jgi:hypothetical protein
MITHVLKILVDKMLIAKLKELEQYVDVGMGMKAIHSFDVL